jgi:hypothetical protein
MWLRNRILFLCLVRVKQIGDHLFSGPKLLHFEPFESIVIIYGPPLRHFEPPPLLNFDVNADSDPAFDLLCTLMRIRIRNTYFLVEL